MIDTVTFAPALDYALWLPHIQPGATNRAEQTRLTVGGKGVNVSILLTRLGVPTRCLGFAAGFAPEILPAMIVGKLTGGIAAVAAAMLLTRRENM